MAKMTREAIVAKMCESEANLTKAAANRLLNVMLDSIVESVASGDGVGFVGFGSFNVKQVPARKGRNPRTKEEIDIPAKRKVKFTAGKAFLERL